MAPLAAKELRKLRRRNEVRNLFDDAVRQVRSDHRVPASEKKAVLKRIRALRVDPTVGGCLKRALDGDSSVLPQLETRVAELLQFGHGVDDREIVLAFMDSVDGNVITARRNDRRALATIYRSQEDGFGGMEQLLGEAVQAGRSAEEAAREGNSSGSMASHQIAGEPVSSSAFAFITSGRSLSSETPELLRELGEISQALASEVAGRLAEGGGRSLTAWASEHRGRVDPIGAEANSVIGRILMSEGAFAAARERFSASAATDEADPARQLVRASNAARAAGQDDEASESREPPAWRSRPSSGTNSASAARTRIAGRDA